MADFTRQKATILAVYRRRPLPGGDEYVRQPFNLVSYDDASGQYVEPIPLVGGLAQTYYDQNDDDTASKQLVVDTIPFDGVTEIR